MQERSRIGSVLANDAATMKNVIKIWVILVLGVAIPEGAWAQLEPLTIEVPPRGKNNLELQPEVAEGERRFNQQDCLQNLKFGFRLNGISTDTNLEPRLLVGSKCNTDPDDSGCKHIKPVSNGTSDHPIEKLFGHIYGDSCISDGVVETSVWLAEFRKDDNSLSRISSAYKFTWDMEPPASPTLSELVPGNEKVQLVWDTDAADADAGDTSDTSDSLDDDVYKIFMLYYDGRSTGRDGSVDTVLDTDLDTGYDAGPAPDGETDTGTAEPAEGYTASASDSDTSMQDAGIDDLTDTAENAVSPLRNLQDRVAGHYGFATRQSTDDDETTGDTEEDVSSVCPTGVIVEGAAYDNKAAYRVSETSKVATGKGDVTGLRNGQAYLFGLVALDTYGNPSVISNTACQEPAKPTGFSDVYGEAGGKGGEFCFIATAAFGSYDHPTVRTLRTFRDEFLYPMPGGVVLIAAYYKLGPRAAVLVEGDSLLGPIVRGALTLFAGHAAPLSVLGPVGTLLLGMLSILGAAVIARRRRS